MGFKEQGRSLKKLTALVHLQRLHCLSVKHTGLVKVCALFLIASIQGLFWQYKPLCFPNSNSCSVRIVQHSITEPLG